MPVRIAIDTSTTVAAPPDEVWRALTDWSRAPRWMPGVQQLRASGATLVPGTTLTFTARGKERTAVVEEVAAPKHLVLVSRSGPVTATYSYLLAAEAHGRTRLRLVAEVRVGGPLALLGAVIRRSIALEDGVQPDRLRALVEGAGAAT